MTPSFLRAEHLSKTFGTVQALKDVSFSAQADELLVILGPTGAGKTTLLRTLSGLDTADTGQIWLDESDVTHLDPAARQVAMVFQNFSLYPRWSVRKNLEFPLRAPGVTLPEEEIQRRVEWVSELLQIARFLDRPATRLSGGEMQRVAIGRAIVRQPLIYLMDEPLTNLDAKLRETLRVELVQLRRRMKRPMVFVTHDQAEALSMADRIVVLSEGCVLQVNTPEDIYENPVSPTVALQLGEPRINLFSATQQDGWWVSSTGMPLAPVLPNHRTAHEVTVGIRPEHIHLGGGAPGHHGRVKVVEYMGPTTTVVFDYGGADVRLSLEGTTEVRPGALIHPNIDFDRVLVWPSN